MKQPLFALSLAPFFAKSLTLLPQFLVPRCGPRSLLRNRTETLAKRATFYTNLPVLDVQIMGVGGRRGCWGAEGGQKKGIEAETAAANKPFPSSKKFHFQNEAKCEIFVVKMSFICIIIKNHFHINGFALSLALKVRFFGTRKWPI